MRVELNSNGALRRFDCDTIAVNLFVGSDVEGGPTNLYVRRRTRSLEWIPLLGPRSSTRFQSDASGRKLIGSGSWRGIHYWVALVLAQNAPAWFWHVRLENRSTAPEELDLTYAQDLALAPYGAVRLNEYYVSQYVDHTPLTHPTQGVVMASRQNLAADGRHPWSLIGSLRNGTAFATDALQFQGLAARAGAAPVGLVTDLPGRRLQHEHSMVVIRDAPIRLDPGQSTRAGFFGQYVPDHPAATSSSDLAAVGEALALSEAKPEPSSFESPVVGGVEPAHSLFSTAPLLETLDLDADSLRALFTSPWRHEEADEQGERLSFFHGDNRHVVLRAKELRVLRPHGHLLRTGRHVTPDESGLTSTVWMSGVFNSMLTQGHVSINRLLSTVHGYLGLFRSQGQRVFVNFDDTWLLLDVPSAFEMGPDVCRWIYRHRDGVIQVRTEARSDPHELALSLEVTAGPPARFLISHHVALDGDDGSAPGAANWRREADEILIAPPTGSWLGTRFPEGGFRIAPSPGTQLERVGGDELLFEDGRSRLQPYVCLITAPGSSVGLRIRGGLIAAPDPAPLRVDSVAELAPRLLIQVPGSSPLGQPVSRLADIVPWYAHNALVHYLAPRGLEQYSGGGWGTRDVCQGPVEMLLALGHIEPVRDLLLRVLANQNPDGDWPQWFMFFERDRDIRAGDSHGDIVFWPLLVLAQYLLASGDSAFLDERASFFDARGPQAGESGTVWQHLERALAVIERRVIPGTALPAYGHGDWNDALQPADPAMREHMCSAWTTTLHYQCFMSLAQALRFIGRTQEATRFERSAAAVRQDFQRLLLVDGVLAGYALFEGGGRVRYLLHPTDNTTGVRYSALAMIHAILEDLFTPEQTRRHLELIEAHLSGPDGARLFDRPMPYHGGPQRFFQRAESATFFGREIGLMYMHAHLRYAQALAHIGEADRFFHALCQATPIAIRSIVPTATLRQANCYYSSSDAAFHDRYQASEEYERIARGTIALDGGWRVYSSGAGIALSLVLRRFLGLSCESHRLALDPVMPASLDGLRIGTTLLKRPVTVIYRVGPAGCGVHGVTLNGQALPFTSASNPHRRGAAVVRMDEFSDRLRTQGNELHIDLG
jgi:cellobiose phosphorylase